MRSLTRRCVNRVIAPEGEILSFSQPLESIQRKGGLIAAQSALLGAANESKKRYCITSVNNLAAVTKHLGIKNCHGSDVSPSHLLLNRSLRGIGNNLMHPFRTNYDNN